jgi:hypothetical protein
MADGRAQQIASFFRSKGSPLASYAQDFVNAADKWGIDYRLLPAISGTETSFGKAGVGVTGPFGYGSATSWGTPQKAIELAAKAIGSSQDTNGFQAHYKNARTISQIGATWAPPGASNDGGGNSGWPSATAQFFKELGGDPNAQVRGLTAGATNSAIQSSAGNIGMPSLPELKQWESKSSDWAMNGGAEPNFQSIVKSLTSAIKSGVQSVGTPQQPSLPSITGTSLPSGGADSGNLMRGGIGGNWNGSLDKALEIQALVGITPSSQKRSRQMTASGGVSDHWVGSTSSYAMDLPGSPGGNSDAAASKIVAALGGPANWGKTGGVFNTTVGGYRYQVLWRTNVGGNHYDHIHVGVKKA